MNLLKIFILFSLSLFFAADTWAQSHRSEQPILSQPSGDCRNLEGITVLKSVFGIGHYQAGKSLVLKPSRRFKLSPGMDYGFQVQINNNSPVQQRLWGRLVLPAPYPPWPEVLKNNPEIILDKSLITALSPIDVAPGPSTVEHTWILMADDPLGLYKMELIREGQIICHFEFVIE